MVIVSFSYHLQEGKLELFLLLHPKHRQRNMAASSAIQSLTQQTKIFKLLFSLETVMIANQCNEGWFNHLSPGKTLCNNSSVQAEDKCLY